jgi:tetratricopeptide (TPR) repeat protein
MTEVKEQLASSGVQVLEVVKAVPEKIDKMGGDLSEAIKVLSENTGAMLDKTEKNISESGKSLESIKEELEKGLKMNTDMTSQMVDLTAKFVDRAEEDRITDLNTRAIGHFNRGEYTESEALFSQALNLAPENSELLCNTAYLKAAMEEMEEAEQLFRKALEITPDLEPAVSGLGLLMVKTDRAEETIEFLKNAIPETDMSVRTVIALSRALAAVGKHAEAVELLETSLRGAPEHPDLKQELAGYGQEEKS